jgi:hypothetical protein
MTILQDTTEEQKHQDKEYTKEPAIIDLYMREFS